MAGQSTVAVAHVGTLGILIPPPVGLNLYVINGMAPGISLKTILHGALPFRACMIVGNIFFAFFPGIATRLPDAAIGASR